MSDNDRSRLDLLLDLLTDEVAARLAARQPKPEPKPEPPPPAVAPALAPTSPPVVESTPEPTPEIVPDVAMPMPSHAASLMTRLALGVLFIVVLINIPFNTQGAALARSIPSSASLVIANGLVVKEETSPDIYVYRDGTFHWITSLDAFDHYGYRWKDVHIVEPGFLDQFDKGKPFYVLLKCDSSPHIYQLDAGRKRWIVDIPTFASQGYVWQDVKFVPCSYLRNLPDGDSVPPGRGTPPPPLP